MCSRQWRAVSTLTPPPSLSDWSSWPPPAVSPRTSASLSDNNRSQSRWSWWTGQAGGLSSSSPASWPPSLWAPWLSISPCSLRSQVSGFTIKLFQFWRHQHFRIFEVDPTGSYHRIFYWIFHWICNNTILHNGWASASEVKQIIISQ